MEKSHPTYTAYGADKAGNIYNKHNKKLSLHDNGNGYLYVGLSCDSKHHNIRASRFIYECFNGIVEKYKIIDHIDNNKLNNKLENLQMITQSANCKKHYKTYEKKYIPAMQVEALNLETNEKKIYKSMTEAGKVLDIKPACIKRICDGIQHMSISKIDGKKYFFKRT